MAGLEDLYARGLISDDALADVLDRVGPEQRPSRSDILASGLDRAKDYLAPSYLRDTPSSPEADRALADPNGKPGKIGPPSGPPTGMQMLGGFAGDVGLNALPLGKFATELATIPFWLKAGTGPRMAARANELREAGHSTKYIADDLGVGTASVGRYFLATGQKTVAAENPYRGVLGDPANDEVIKAGLARGDSYETIAKRLGAQYSSVQGRVTRLRAAGELSDIELRPSNQSRALLADPVKRADLIRLAEEGTSQGDIASYFFGGPGGKHPRRGEISQHIKRLKEEGTPEEQEALKDYRPQFGKGLTPAGRTPTTVQTKTQARPITPEDLEFGQDFARALSALMQGGPSR